MSCFFFFRGNLSGREHFCPCSEWQYMDSKRFSRRNPFVPLEFVPPRLHNEQRRLIPRPRQVRRMPAWHLFPRGGYEHGSAVQSLSYRGVLPRRKLGAGARWLLETILQWHSNSRDLQMLSRYNHEPCLIRSKTS